MGRFDHRVAVITGAARGIGFGIAQRFASEGASIAILDLDETAAQEAAGRLELADGASAIGVGCDVVDSAAAEAAVQRVVDELGGIHILVNNAGVTRDNLLVRLSELEWDEVLSANLRGAFVATQAVIKGMMKRRAGRIINITSVVGLTGNKGQANYAASKAGLIGFTKSVAKEYAGRGILANCIAPGYIVTDMTAALPEAAQAALLEAIPLGRLGSPADIAGAVLFLASDLGSYVTGQVLVVDGGMIG